MNADEFTTIDLLRHGQCEGGEIYRGHSDVSLTETGWQQMQRSLDYLEQPWPWQHIISSPLLRCSEFAAQLAQQLGVKWHSLPDLMEMSFGVWDGMAIADVWREYPEQAERFMLNPAGITPPGGESLAELQQRVLAGWRQMLERYRGQHLLSIQHGGTIRVILAEVLNMPLDAVVRLHVPYASLCRIRVYHDPHSRPQLMFHNPTEPAV